MVEAMAAQRPKFTGRPAGDSGESDQNVTEALTNWQNGAGSEREALRALAATRFLVPVVAILTAQDEETKAEKESEMALPTLIGNDGRAAIIAFTGVETMKRWRPDARPVVAPAARVWHAAVAEGQAVVIDIAGPTPFVVEGARLASLAKGEQPPFPHEDPDVRAVVESAVAAWPHVAGFTLAPGSAPADLAVTLRVASAASVDEARQAAQSIATGLAPRLRRGVELSVELPA
jgi:hypothetical protein